MKDLSGRLPCGHLTCITLRTEQPWAPYSRVKPDRACPERSRMGLEETMTDAEIAIG